MPQLVDTIIEQGKTYLKRYFGYASLIAPFGFFVNWATTISATPELIGMHALTMFLIGPILLTVSHLIIDFLMSKSRPPKWTTQLNQLISAIIAQFIGMILTTLVTASVLETLFSYKNLLAGPLFAASSLVLATLIIITLFTAYKARELDFIKEKNLQTEAKLQSLTHQLQPHFLYNSLNVLAEIVRVDPILGSDGIISLSRLYQSIVDLTQSPLISLDEEMAVISDYLKIQKLRFSDRLKVEMSISPNKVKIPPLTVFNLVENAVKYGISSMPGAGSIRIEAGQIKDRFIISVLNSPCMELKTHHTRSGTGLKNLKERLHFAFGDKAHFSLEVKNGGAIASVSLES